MSFRYIVCCNGCGRIQGILTPNDTIRNDGGGVLPWELPSLGWEEDADGKHTCPICAESPRCVCGHLESVHDGSECRGTPMDPQAADIDGYCPCNGFTPRRKEGEN